mmetsp:Transcript_10394/g.10468  ORF Transcript_10394/g.10468 Transcript_10394/m.10468 type:complete len:391 (+) Transcript_10394:93-1265(+)
MKLSLLSFVSSSNLIRHQIRSGLPQISQVNLLPDADMLLANVSPWSVDGTTLNATDIAASLFGISLFPYLLLLFFLARPIVNTPKMANFGFQFLLAFVFATIPAGIYAKVQYQDILANIDWLHGTAESLLTITNLLIVYGFRKSRPQPEVPDDKQLSTQVMRDMSIPIILATIVISSSLSSIFPHNEPLNALSIPTWMVHVSSLQEWLIAMKLVWEHSMTSNNSRWKGMTWGMLPSHTSGVCACTYHLFYNSPSISWIVAVQAFLTVFGNSTMAYAAYRIFQFENNKRNNASVEEINSASSSDTDANINADETGLIPLNETDGELATKILVTSVLASIVVKYGELFSDIPFDPVWYAPLSIIAFSTAIHGSLYTLKSFKETEEKSEVVTL